MNVRHCHWFKALTIIALSQFLVFLLSCDLVLAQNATKTLPAGTPVIIRIDQMVSSKNVIAGTQISASVVSDVIMGGTVIIRAGSPCNATILRASKAGVAGQAGEVILQVNSVIAADGTSIPLTGATITKIGDSKLTEAVFIAVLCCILGILIKGKQGEIAAGSQVTGYTVSAAVQQSISSPVPVQSTINIDKLRQMTAELQPEGSGVNYVVDANEALLVVISELDPLTFASNIGIIQVDRRGPGVYWLHLNPGTNWITIYAEGYMPYSDRFYIDRKAFKVVHVKG